MALLDLFRKRPSHRQLVHALFEELSPEAKQENYPNGEQQLDAVLRSLAKLCRRDLHPHDKGLYNRLMRLHFDVLVRFQMNLSGRELAESLHRKFPHLIGSYETAKQIAAFVNINMQDRDFSLEMDEDYLRLRSRMDMLFWMDSIVQSNAAAERRGLKDPEYGLATGKPIYTAGIKGSHQYLNALKTERGEPLTWKRKGSVLVLGINGPVDVYEGSLPNGEIYQTLYINMYGSDNSRQIPKGFTR